MSPKPSTNTTVFLSWALFALTHHPLLIPPAIHSCVSAVTKYRGRSLHLGAANHAPWHSDERVSTLACPLLCHSDRRNGPLRSIAAQSPMTNPRAQRSESTTTRRRSRRLGAVRGVGLRPMRCARGSFTPFRMTGDGTVWHKRSTDERVSTGLQRKALIVGVLNAGRATVGC